MKAAEVSTSCNATNISTALSINGTGDFNGDNKSDILWRQDSTGNVAMWQMNGAGLLANILIGNIPTNWTVQSANAN